MGNSLVKFKFDIVNGDSIVFVFVMMFDNSGKWLYDGGNVIFRK